MSRANRRPSTPIALTGTEQHLSGRSVLPDTAALDELGQVCELITDLDEVTEASRDWWPIALHWSLHGAVPRRAGAVARPTTTQQVAQIMTICASRRIPVTPSAGRSGVCGAAVPLHGGIVLDLTGLNGVVAVDPISETVTVRAGTFGPDLEDHLRTNHGLSVGHFPQSFEISTVGGWIASRGAGQYSTRYGKIEDMVVGLEVVLADGSIITTGGAPAAAVGPDLSQVFIGSEGTLGVVCTATLRCHRIPDYEQRAAYRFDSFAEGIDACRKILQAGATPAVLRLYDAVETARSHGGDGTECVLLVLDEGEPAIVDATMSIIAGICTGQRSTDETLVEHWLEHRNDTSALQALTERGYVVDTMEIAGPWSALPEIYHSVCSAVMEVPGALAASCHLSHSYVDGACLYFSFAGQPSKSGAGSAGAAGSSETVSLVAFDQLYRQLWDAAQGTVLATGGNLSHHHGIGLNRSRFVATALGQATSVLGAIKDALDPHGILNPGKLGLHDRFGPIGWLDDEAVNVPDQVSGPIDGATP